MYNSKPRVKAGWESSRRVIFIWKKWGGGGRDWRTNTLLRPSPSGNSFCFEEIWISILCGFQFKPVLEFNNWSSTIKYCIRPLNFLGIEYVNWEDLQRRVNITIIWNAKFNNAAPSPSHINLCSFSTFFHYLWELGNPAL